MLDRRVGKLHCGPGRRTRDVLHFGAGIFPTHGFSLHALDPQTGQTLWRNDTSGNLRQNHITGGYAFGNVTSQGYLAGGRVYLIDCQVIDPAAARRGLETIGAARLVALDTSTGGVLWMSEDNIVGSMLTASEPFDVVLMGSVVKERGTLFSDYPQVLAAFRGEDGHKLWEKQVLLKQRPMIVDGTLTLSLTARTGAPILSGLEIAARPSEAATR